MAQRVMSDGRIAPHSASNVPLALHPVISDGRLSGHCLMCGLSYHTVVRKDGLVYLRHDAGAFWRS